MSSSAPSLHSALHSSLHWIHVTGSPYCTASFCSGVHPGEYPYCTEVPTPEVPRLQYCEHPTCPGYHEAPLRICCPGAPRRTRSALHSQRTGEPRHKNPARVRCELSFRDPKAD